MKKFAHSAVAAAALGFAASSVFAAVNIDASPAVPAVFANEIVASASANATLINAANVLDLASSVGYALSNGEVRYVRVELANATFSAAPGTPAISSVGASVGAVNISSDKSYIYFSITAAAAGIAAADTLTIAPTLKIAGTTSPVTVNFSVYDQPSQAQAGGSTGRIVNKSATFVSFAPSYTVAVTTDSAVSNVEAVPTFTQFAAGQTTGSLLVARLAALDYKLPTTVPKLATGVAATLPTLVSTTSNLVVSGDFTAAANANGSYTGAALARVYLSTGTNCTTVAAVNATAVTASSATFNVGQTATTANPNLCYAPFTTATTPPQIAASTYTANLAAVSVDTTTLNVLPQDKGQVSVITRNGTELQAPLFQAPGGYLSRFALTNTGSVAATYTAVVRGEAGNTFSSGTLTGTIPAGGQVIINGSDLGTFSGSQRGFVVFTVNRPNTQIQGVFQLTNTTSGAVTNTVMVRPGTN